MDSPPTPPPAPSAGPIVAGVDLSPYALDVVCWAARLARLTGQPLHVVHVVHDPGDRPGYYREDAQAPTETLLEAARRQVDAFVADARAQCAELAGLADVHVQIVEGLPATRLIEVAEAVAAALVAVGSRGRTGLRRLLLGSKAERVARLAPMPVVLVKAGTP